MPSESAVAPLQAGADVPRRSPRAASRRTTERTQLITPGRAVLFRGGQLKRPLTPGAPAAVRVELRGHGVGGPERPRADRADPSPPERLRHSPGAPSREPRAAAARKRGCHSASGLLPRTARRGADHRAGEGGQAGAGPGRAAERSGQRIRGAARHHDRGGFLRGCRSAAGRRSRHPGLGGAVGSLRPRGRRRASARRASRRRGRRHGGRRGRHARRRSMALPEPAAFPTPPPAVRTGPTQASARRT